MTVPDAWDECGGCGHDRDDHTDDADALCGIPGCGCQRFKEPA